MNIQMNQGKNLNGNLKVSIVGKGEGWEVAPEDAWGVNDLILRRPVSLLFEMHKLDNWRRDPLLLEIINKVNETKTPMMTLEKHPSVPTSITFPLEKVVKRFGEYFTSSIDYMLSYALLIGVTELDLYGISTIHQNHRASSEYWIGYAKGLGVKVNIISSNADERMLPLYSSKRYGYDK